MAQSQTPRSTTAVGMQEPAASEAIETSPLASALANAYNKIGELEHKLAWLTWVVRRHARSEYHGVLDSIATDSAAEPLPVPVGERGMLTEPTRSDIDGAPPA